MKRLAIGAGACLVAASALVLLVGSSSASTSKSTGSPNTQGQSGATSTTRNGSTTTFQGQINAADDTARYTVTTSGKVKIKWEIADCCVVGDHYGLTYIDTATGKVTGSKKCSTANSVSGSPSDSFSNMAQAQTTGGTLIVYYCDGVDLFSAGVWIRYTPNKDGLITSVS